MVKSRSQRRADRAMILRNVGAHAGAAVGLFAVVVAAALALGTASADGAEWEQPFVPTPIGAGPAYQPAPRWPLAGAAGFRGLQSNLRGRLRVHLELFASRRVVVVPSGIGVSGGRTELYGHIVDALWHAPAWTLQAGGVIQLERSGMRLSDVFAVWGHAIGPTSLLGFRGPVLVFVNGRPRGGSPGDVVLRDHDQVVVQINGYLPPHPTFVFAPDGASDARGG
jgi:hypothetical protein